MATTAGPARTLSSCVRVFEDPLNLLMLKNHCEIFLPRDVAGVYFCLWNSAEAFHDAYAAFERATCVRKAIPDDLTAFFRSAATYCFVAPNDVCRCWRHVTLPIDVLARYDPNTTFAYVGHRLGSSVGVGGCLVRIPRGRIEKMEKEFSSLAVIFAPLAMPDRLRRAFDGDDRSFALTIARANLAPIDPRCKQCGAVAASRCGGCRFIFYCSKRCQRAHWTTHKRRCEFDAFMFTNYRIMASGVMPTSVTRP